jgi:hypothetical protein
LFFLVPGGETETARKVGKSIILWGHTYIIYIIYIYILLCIYIYVCVLIYIMGYIYIYIYHQDYDILRVSEEGGSISIYGRPTINGIPSSLWTS